MHAWARSAAVLAATVFAILAVLNAVAIYGFDQFEPMWGRGPSFQVGLWLATAASLVCLVGGGFGYRAAARRCAIPVTSTAVGVAVVVLCVSGGIIYLVGPALDAARPLVAVVVLAASAWALSFLSCVVIRKGGARAA